MNLKLLITRLKPALAREKRALLRLLRIYAPIFLGFYLCMAVVGWLIEDKKPVMLQDVILSADQVPVVYSAAYNIGFFGLEKFHPFDGHRYGKVYDRLLQDGFFKAGQNAGAGMPPEQTLKLAHTDEYLESIQHSWTIARITEMNFLKFFPSNFSRNIVLVPMLYQTGGSVLAPELALKRGWAINLGGGFHHASARSGGGFCVIADITISIRNLQKEHPEIKKAMIIDLDAHQGNGYQRDFRDNPDIFVVDVYNSDIYPHDEYAKKKIDVKRELHAFTGDKLYLSTVTSALEEAFKRFKPDIIYYNAGSDILDGDPLGALSVSSEGVMKRDEMVFKEAFARKIPIVMLLAGGYQKVDAAVIASSIENLNRKFGLFAATTVRKPGQMKPNP
jgi:histone deacetylase 11